MSEKTPSANELKRQLLLRDAPLVAGVNADAAEEAADDAVKGATLAKQFADQAGRDRQRVEELTPDPHRDMVQALASQEQAALLRFLPRHNKWRDLQEFENQLVEIQQRRASLQDQIGDLENQLRRAPEVHMQRLADWMADGQAGARPASEAPELEHRLADLKAEFEALGIQYDRTLRDKAEHVVGSRRRLVKDTKKEKEKLAAEQRRLIDELEANRQKLLDLRRTEVWAAIFPNEAMTSEPTTGALAGGVRKVQEPLFPGLKAGLPAAAVLELLRRDIDYCTQVATLEQLAAERGVTVPELTGREARWQNAEPDLVGPSFPAVWSGSDEEKAVAEREREYTRQHHRRLWGEEPSWGD